MKLQETCCQKCHSFNYCFHEVPRINSINRKPYQITINLFVKAKIMAFSASISTKDKQCDLCSKLNKNVWCCVNKLILIVMNYTTIWWIYLYSHHYRTWMCQSQTYKLWHIGCLVVAWKVGQTLRGISEFHPNKLKFIARSSNRKSAQKNHFCLLKTD